MVSKVTHLNKLFMIMIIVFVILTLILSPLAESIPINLHYVYTLHKQISNKIYHLEVHKPMLNLIGDESYSMLTQEIDMDHSVKVIDKAGELRRVNDRTLDQQYRVLSSIEDIPEEVLTSYKEILLSNYRIEDLKVERALAFMSAATFIFLSIALISLTLDDFHSMRLIEAH